MIKKLISTAIVSSVIGSASANPELGYMTVGTDQYQLFNATIAIDALPSELTNKKLKVKLGSITDFYRHNIEYDKQVSSLRFKVARDGDGKPLIRVRSVREINTNKLKAVIKLKVGRQKIYGIYDFNLTPNKERQVTLNLLNTDHKPAEKPVIVTTKALGLSTLTAKTGSPVVQPVAQPVAQPLPPEISTTDAGKDSPMTSSSGHYQVTAGQSISGIAMELLPLYPEVSSWRILMNRLASLNPGAFINGDVNKLRADAQLTLPGSARQIAQAAGRDKIHGLYEPGSGNSEQQITFNLSDTSNGKKPQPVVKTSPSAKTSGQVAKQQALEELHKKLKSYEQAETHDTHKPVNNNLSSSQASGDAARKKDLEALRKKLSEYEQAKKTEVRRRQNRAANQRRAGSMVSKGSQPSLMTGAMTGAKTYQIAKGDTLSTIAMKLSKAYPGSKSWRKVMKLLVRDNPDAFIGGDINRIRAGTVLSLPEFSHYDHLYEVVAGDNISTIAQRMQYKYPQPTGWQGMMKQIVYRNQKAFINGNPNRIRANEILIIPGSGAVEIEAEMEELPQKQPEIKKSNAYHQSKREKTDQRLAKLNRKSLATPKEQPVQQKAETIYKVSESESLATIAHKLVPDYPQFDSWYELLQELARLNPSLFMDNDIGAIKKGTVLQLPEKKSRRQTMDSTQMQPKPAGRSKGQPVSVRKPGETMGSATAPSYNKISNSLLSRIGKTPEYKVPRGYTISMVAIKLLPLYPEYDDWTSLMDDIYKLNPDAFINSDINRLRDNSRLKLPQKISS